MLVSLGKWVLKVALIAAFVTGVGQIPFRGENLENRYHRYVNSDAFQRAFQVVAKPVAWTSERVSELIANARERGREGLSSR